VKTRIHLKCALLLIAPLVVTPVLLSQTSGEIAAPHKSTVEIAPGPRPPDVSVEWKQLVGIYRYNSHNAPGVTMIFLEKDQKLFMQEQGPAGKPEQVFENDRRVIIPDRDGRGWVYHERRDSYGTLTGFSYLVESFTRTDAGSDLSRFYHITPSKPIAELRAQALAAKPPVGTQPFRKPELVELITLNPALHLDIRYAQSNNFLSTPVYSQARAFMQRPAADALLRVLYKLQPLGYGLLIHDAYRPWYVTKIFWDATPPADHIFVADPNKGSRHNRGCAVDLTLYDLASGLPVEMPGLYDEMSPRSFPTFPGGTSLQRWHRDLLRRAMESEGFTVNEDEWWHFDYKDWKYYPILNVPFERLNPASLPS
jgi:D-alanyl-D-alanine dipeptidase